VAIQVVLVVPTSPGLRVLGRGARTAQARRSSAGALLNELIGWRRGHGGHGAHGVTEPRAHGAPAGKWETWHVAPLLDGESEWRAPFVSGGL
jgi:hypothetical protein